MLKQFVGLAALLVFLFASSAVGDAAGNGDSSSPQLVPGGWLQSPPMPADTAPVPAPPPPRPAPPRPTHRAVHHPQPAVPVAPASDGRVRF